MELDSLDKAIKNFDIATKVDPTEASYYYYRGKAKEKKGNKTEAKADYEQALRFDADLKEAKKSLSKLR